MSTLAAARADNFYYPQGWDPSKGSLNQYHNSHPLGQRAKKIKQGILVIRFEIPFHVRCMGECKKMIGKGVRFNAEKKCVGNFHSTKIWEFSFRCHLCPQRIVVRTDPENTEYKFIEGACKILDTSEATDVEFMRAEEEKRKIAEDPFYKLENDVKDIQKGKEEKSRLQEIFEVQDNRSRDDYELNSLMRKKFRIEKKQIEAEEKEKQEYKNVALPLPELTFDDKLAAKNAKFLGLDAFRTNRLMKRENIRTESIFKNVKNPQQSVMINTNRLPTDTKNLIKRNLAMRDGNQSAKPKITVKPKK